VLVHKHGKERGDVQIMTGVAEASLPTSSSICMIFLMRAWMSARDYDCQLELYCTHDGELRVSGNEDTSS